MPDPTPEFLTDILGQVLQESAFIFAEPDQEPEQWSGTVLAARIAFESTRGGSLRLLTSPEGAAEIAANMLGIEQGEEARESGRAALSELLNVLGGAFVTRYFGTAVPSQLGLPSTEVGPAPPPARARSCAAAVRLEGGELLVLELDLEQR
ncbi:MAG TPA: chemotaxis protein CheX [Anaeromyxobacter sp.]|nr:chemotaxis protein CheX [Anaeromyxobacter sp.]